MQLRNLLNNNIFPVCKGRKRVPVNSASNMHELIHDYVLPKWKIYLKEKAERRVAKSLLPRSDTIWKKILRDLREFYRLLFRNRFHHLEFKDEEGVKK